MTLIEVLAALALLGSLAVAMVLSRGRLVEQHQRAEQKVQAVQYADALLAEWWGGGRAAFPTDDEDTIGGREGWVWQTRVLPKRELEPFGARVVRLRILDTTPPGQPVELTSVDVVLPQGGTR